MSSQPCDHHVVTIKVEPCDDGCYEVVSYKDGEFWMLNARYADLASANAHCTKLLAYAQGLVERFTIKHNQ